MYYIHLENVSVLMVTFITIYDSYITLNVCRPNTTAFIITTMSYFNLYICYRLLFLIHILLDRKIIFYRVLLISNK